MNKKGNSDFGEIVGGVLGVIIFVYIIFIIISSGVAGNIVSSFSALGAYGTLAGILFLIALMIGIWEKLFN
jgi:hypothetical protein